MSYADTIAAELIRAHGNSFVGKIIFHVPPRGRILMVTETKLPEPTTRAWAIDKGRATALRSVPKM